MFQALRLMHILAALWFSGGMVAFVLVHMRLRRVSKLAECVFYLRFSLLLTKLAIVPGGLISALVGIALAMVEGYNILQTPWQCLSLVLFIYATAMGMFYLTPNDRYAMKVAEEAMGKGIAEVQNIQLVHRRRVAIIRMINVSAVLALILLMILRPII